MQITNTEVTGFPAAIRSMRNPMNSWERSDSNKADNTVYEIGPEDLALAKRLIKLGPEHCKFLRFIHVTADFEMPRYWWSEADTYHFGTKNSCSTMHKLLNTDEPITMDQFIYCEEDEAIMAVVVTRLEFLRKTYKDIQAGSDSNKKDLLNRLLLRAKRILPESFLQLRTWDTNYAELRNIYFQRRNHRLKGEWVETFCSWVESLPYASDLIIYEGDNGKTD